jgi:hypothetical protein
LSANVSASDTAQHNLLLELEALVAALMGDALPAEITSIVGRLEAAADHQGELPAAVIDEVRRAIGLVRSGQPCAAVSALLAARSELATPPS